MSIITYAIDIGSTKPPNGSFGWARLERNENNYKAETGKNIENLNKRINSDIKIKSPLSLGVECPLFLSVPEDSENLSTGRKGEEDRSCFAPAGGYVGFLGIHQLSYLLQNIDLPKGKIRLKWDPKPNLKNNEIFLWEAFVSKDAHTEEGNDEDDAITAGYEFMERWLKEEQWDSDIECEEDVQILSTAGASILWSGLGTDRDLLRQEAFVVKPEDKFEEDRVEKV